MVRISMILCTSIACATAFATAATQSPPSQVTVALAPVRGSDQRGTAILTQRGNKLIVNVRMSVPQGTKMQETGSPMMAKSGPLAAHIHRGSCPNPDKTPLYPLNPVTKGSSTTTLTSTTLDKLTGGNYTVSVHKSAHDIKNPIACGDIKLANPTGATQ
jgi:hypothetical protein